MKIAFLILAHHQPRHLARLVAALRGEGVSILIHIDRKSCLSSFKSLVPPDEQTHFLEGKRRINVQWGGYSQVQATLNLLDAAITLGIPFDRFCLLSGSDFPLKGLDAIRKKFSGSSEFLRVDRKVAPETPAVYKNVRYLWFYDFPQQLKGRISGKIRRRVYRKIPLYHGCQWWALSAGCIDYLRRFLSDNPDYIRFHRRTLCVDEIFFHSIIKASPYAALISHDFEAQHDQAAFSASNDHGCHYVDWTAQGVPLPKVLDVSDLPRLMQSEALFVRKCQEGVSDALVDRLERFIC